jgi:hypothetical protein
MYASPAAERWEDALFLGYDAAYTVCLALDTAKPDALRLYGAMIMLAM